MSKTKLPYLTLVNLSEFIDHHRPEDLHMTSLEYNDYRQFLLHLRDVYIECSKCRRMIAPDEIYEIENEEAVCEECSDGSM